MISETKIKEIFSNDTYETPIDTPNYWGDKLLFHSRWWFYILFGGIVTRSSRLSVKGLYNDFQWMRASYDILRDIEGCGGRFKIQGLNNLRKSDEPIVIVSNHISTLETVIFPCLVTTSRPATFVVKDKLVKGPIFGPIMKSRNPIVVGRQNPREDFRIVMTEGEKRLKDGKSLIIFPQSTRTPHFIPEKFNSLGIKLCQKTGAHILPVAIKTDFWGDSKIIKGFGPLSREKTIFMTFGEPFPVQGNGKEDHQRVIDFISRHLDEWSSEGCTH